METIVVASQNPVKIQSVRRGFARTFPEDAFAIRTVSVPSGVSHQPRSDQETLQGALTRARNAAEAVPSGDFWMGIEGGVAELGGEMAAFAWIVVLSPTRTGKSRTGAFFLPPAVANLVRQGKELGEADDIVFDLDNSKQAAGAIGILSGNTVDRTELYEQAVVLALLPFKNPELYL